MHIPILFQDNANHIRQIDPDAREVRFDKNAWQNAFRQAEWNVPAENAARYIQVMEELPDGILSAASIKAFQLPPLPLVPNAHEIRLLTELFLMVMVWTYGPGELGPRRAVRKLMEDNNRPFPAWFAGLTRKCHFGRLAVAYADVSRLAQNIKAECCANFLYFLFSKLDAVIKPLPYDMEIAKGLRRLELEDEYLQELTHNHLARDHWQKYCDYVILIHNWAASIGCRPDQLVEFLRLRGQEIR
jgi:hypothetical protein